MCSIFNHCWSVGYVSLLTFSLIHNLFVFLNLFKTFHIPWERVSVDMAVWGQFWLVPTGWPLWTWPGLVWDKKVWLASVSIHLPPCANSTSVGVEKTSQTKVIPIYQVFKFCRTISYTLGIQLALVIVRVDIPELPNQNMPRNSYIPVARYGGIENNFPNYSNRIK